MTHFGVMVREGKHGLKLTRENYAIVSKKRSLPVFRSITYDDNEEKTYSDEWCNVHLKNCMENFDLNMEYMSNLSRADFELAINNFLENNKGLKPVFDLTPYDGKAGYYMMVLDEYRQVYIGTTDDIKHRIMTHWSKSTPFDRLLFPIGAVNTSLLSIDSFRAYDTTRIYVHTTTKTYVFENAYMSQFPPEFVCNRINGGKIKGGLLQTIAMMKHRQLR